MSRTRKIVFSVIFITLLILAVVPYYRNFKDIRNPKDNPAEEIVLKEGGYEVGPDLKRGVYDIICLSEKGEYFGQKYDEGEKFIGLELFKTNGVDIEKGTFLFTPTSFEPININTNGNYELIWSGIYDIGYQIPAGKYIIYPLLQDVSGTIDVNITKNYRKYKDTILLIDEKSNPQQLELHKGEQIVIDSKYNDNGEEDSNIKIILEPLQEE